MKTTTAGVLASLLTLAAAAKSDSTFAVLRFNGDGFMTEGRVDPIVNPGGTSPHLHGIMGGSNFGATVQGDQLLNSKCTSAMITNDLSNYWVPQAFFHNKDNNTFTKVPLFYMNVYYFFEPTDDDLKPFPPGLKIVVGDANTRDPPKFGGGSNVNPDAGPIQPVQFTCPRSSYSPPSYIPGSDGKSSGMQDPNNQGAGAGFPLYPCDGYASPLRGDIHFPSCYNPAAGLDDYKNNMAYPKSSNGKLNCPSGWTHVPHLFYEVYWNTPLFDKLWTPDGKTQPFVLANGDVTGYSLHADFIAGWDENTLQTIMNTCNAGSIGMDKCPQIPGGLNSNKNCKIDDPIAEKLSLSGALTSLPGNCPLSGWSYGSAPSSGGSSAGSGSSSSASSSAVKTSAQGSSTSAAAASSTGASTSLVKTKTAATTQTVPAASTTKLPNSSQTASAAGNYATAASADVGIKGSSPNAGAGPAMSTVWDVVTVTQTETVWAEETAPVKRHGGHLARHRRSYW